jgi:hypothetical protein
VQPRLLCELIVFGFGYHRLFADCDPARRPPPCLRDPYPRELDRLPAHDHALRFDGREPGAHQLD